MDPQLIFQQIRQLKLTQDDLKREIFEVKAGKVKVVINGELKVLEIKLPKSPTEKDQKDLIGALNSAIRKAEKNTLKAIEKLSK